MGNRSHNFPANVFNKYYCNIKDELRIQQANIESTELSLKEAFSQGCPEVISIPGTVSKVKYTIRGLKNGN